MRLEAGPRFAELVFLSGVSWEGERANRRMSACTRPCVFWLRRGQIATGGGLAWKPRQRLA